MEALKIYLFKSSINFTRSIEITFEIIHWFLKYHVYVRFRKRETKNRAESNKKRFPEIYKTLRDNKL